MSGLVLRLAGPMQSWGEHSVFGHRDTHSHPTRSGMVGLFAAARGIPRGGDLSEYGDVSFAVRIDRPGDHLVDYHTVGGGLPPKRTVPTAEGKRRPRDSGTVQTWRSYLAGAVFTVAVAGPDQVITDTAEALRRPRWQPYLGRRAFPPEQPMLLKSGIDDPVSELRHHVPLPPGRRARPRMDMVYEAGSADATTVEDTDMSRTILNDVPMPADTPGGVERSFASREVIVVSEKVPANLVTSELRTYRKKLVRYMEEGRAR